MNNSDNQTDDESWRINDQLARMSLLKKKQILRSELDKSKEISKAVDSEVINQQSDQKEDSICVSLPASYWPKSSAEAIANRSSNLADLICLIVQWHYDRNLIDGSSDKDQTLKLLQELGELSDSVCKGKDVRDDLGDMMVVMLNIMERNSLTLEMCLEKAYEDIKDRKGKMVDGVFIKQEDL